MASPSRERPARDPALAAPDTGRLGRWGLRLLLAVMLLAEGGALWQLFQAEGGRAEVAALEQRIEAAERRNRLLDSRNALLLEEVIGLRTGSEAIESRARFDLGMIRKGEVFVRIDD